MKNILLLIALAVVTFTANAQKINESELPLVVKNNFEKQHPNTKVKGWEKEHGNYEVELLVDEKEMTIVYDVRGNLVQTETDVTVNDLPAAAKEYCAKQYAGSTIKEASKIVDALGVITYEAEINKMDVIFDVKGNFLQELKN